MAHPFSQKKILLGMLVSNGDCLLTTVIARQIKKDFPGSHLTWAISDKCRQVIENNPDIDAIWEIKISSVQSALNEDWKQFRLEAERKKAEGEFDHVFYTQIYPDNVWHYDGTTRGTIYNSYPNKISVDARPELRLMDTEKKKVAEFALRYGLEGSKNVILFECSSFSGQSAINSGWAMDVAEGIAAASKDCIIILSTHENLASPNPRILVANTLSLRENAALSHYCGLLIGCSSGITWMCTSTAAKLLPMIQFLKRGFGFSFASVAYDHRIWGLDDSSIIETTNPDKSSAIELVLFVLKNGIKAGREKYHQKLRPRFNSMLRYSFMFFRRGQIGRSLGVIKNFIARNYIK